MKSHNHNGSFIMENLTSHNQRIIGYNINVPFEPVCGTEISQSQGIGVVSISPLSLSENNDIVKNERRDIAKKVVIYLNLDMKMTGEKS